MLDEVVERIGPDAFEKKIISFANETEGGLSLKAYALDALNRMDTKTDFRI